jgi:hypothetical protein
LPILHNLSRSQRDVLVKRSSQAYETNSTDDSAIGHNDCSWPHRDRSGKRRYPGSGCSADCRYTRSYH